MAGNNQAAMAAVDEQEMMETFEHELTQETAQVVPLPRSVQIHREAQTLPSVRLENKRQALRSEIESLEEEIAQREAVAAANIERLRGDVDEHLIKLRASLHTLLETKRAAMADFSNSEEALRRNMKDLEETLQLRQREIISESQRQIKAAQDMIAANKRSLGDE